MTANETIRSVMYRVTYMYRYMYVELCMYSDHVHVIFTTETCTKFFLPVDLAYGLIYIAEGVSAAKRALARVLLIIVCEGFGTMK